MADTQWEELDGSATLVRSKADRYTAIADAIQRSTKALDSIVTEISTKSLAMDETRNLAETVRESIDKAQLRYHEAGDALSTYADGLEAAKDRANPAARELRRLRDELSTARTRAWAAQTDVDSLPATATPEERAEATGASTRAGNHVGDLEAQVTHQENEWTAGHQAKDSAARKAASQIEEVVTGKLAHGLKDGFWDKAGEVWDGVYKIVKIVCDVAGILAIFLSWVPILGQVLLVLAAVGAILAVVNAVFNAARGKGSWWGVVGAAALAVLSLFGGKAISAIAKYSKARIVVQSAGRMSPRVAKATFGTTTLKSTRKVFAMTTGQRVTGVLKSPFVRSAGDKAVAGMIKNGAYSQAARKLFPNPFSGAGMRALFRNDDVADMLSTMAIAGTRVDNVASTTASVAAVGAIGITTFNGVRNTISAASELGYGDPGHALGPGVSLGSSPLGGPYGNLVGGAIKLAGDAIPPN
ncbi:hypothetical protein ATJ88_3326 [Isoptericola jiangsuensis]|uniref:Uncharacterized protein n=1 Tax=Isoptericola jiangsuensis TaxID=548579 RepID=A0A2A9F1B0_9MICO|nr:hypothetical protein [Isoptericola jiangsuensis]PFG44596.1 hypothetical protein ATJ88_3326 [Isoptericola jiangsuensis]